MRSLRAGWNIGMTTNWTSWVVRAKRFIALAFFIGICTAAAAQATGALPVAGPRNAVKFTFLSWFSGSTKVSYERAFGQDVPQSGEVALDIIGAGFDKYDNNPRGLVLRYGHKFFIGRHNPETPLKGFFLRPEIIGTNFTYDGASSGARETSQMIALLATAGYQYTVKHFIVDIWFGSGWCGGTPADTLYEHSFSVWNYLDTYNPHIAMSFSIRLGFCF